MCGTTCCCFLLVDTTTHLCDTTTLSQEKNKINKDGELVLQSSRYRTQHQNFDDALEKMQSFINRASKLPAGLHNRL